MLIEGPGYIGGDGHSIMPATPAMTLAQLIDLVAYLKSDGSDAGHADDESREQTAGGYRVKLAFLPITADGHRDHAHHQHGAGAPTGQGQGNGRSGSSSSSRTPRPVRPSPTRRSDAHRGGGQTRADREARARLRSGGVPPRRRRDAGRRHPQEVTVSVGPAALKIGAGAPAPARPAQTIIFDWK